MQVVGELGYVEGTSANGVLYRVYTYNICLDAHQYKTYNKQ